MHKNESDEMNRLFDIWESEPTKENENKLWALIACIVRKIAEDDDPSQETLRLLFQTISTGKYKHEGKLDRLVSVATKHKNLQAYRNAGRRHARVSTYDPDLIDYVQEPEYGQQTLLVDLRKIENPVTRELARLLLEEGMAMPDAAKACGLTYGAARARLRNIKNKEDIFLSI